MNVLYCLTYSCNAFPFVLCCLGPPEESTNLQYEDITAVSITISWTAGYDGGSKQTLYVVYQQEGTIDEHEELVETDEGISEGDVETHKLKVQ